MQLGQTVILAYAEYFFLPSSFQAALTLKLSQNSKP